MKVDLLQVDSALLLNFNQFLKVVFSIDVNGDVAQELSKNHA